MATEEEHQAALQVVRDLTRTLVGQTAIIREAQRKAIVQEQIIDAYVKTKYRLMAELRGLTEATL